MTPHLELNLTLESRGKNVQPAVLDAMALSCGVGLVTQALNAQEIHFALRGVVVKSRAKSGFDTGPIFATGTPIQRLNNTWEHGQSLECPMGRMYRGAAQAPASLALLLLGLTLAVFACGSGQETERLADLSQLDQVPVSTAYPRAEGWPEFRGPDGQGHSTASGLPLIWSDSQNIAWKVSIPGRGWSSPVVLGELIWMTTATDHGASLRAVAVDPANGSLVHNVEVFRNPTQPPINEKNSYASPTPILEEDRVYVHFGALGTAALDTSGKIVWTNQELRYEHGHGPGGSPALAGDLLIINCDGTDRQFVVALDKQTGAIRWKRDRVDGEMAYSTPLVIRVGDSDQVLSSGANRTVAYDLKTGKEIWWVRYRGYSLVPRPIVSEGLAYLTTGFDRPSLLAVSLAGRGDVTDSHVAWRTSRGVPRTSSPLVAGGLLYFVSDNGILSCLDARTGDEHYRQRLNGEFTASPIYADGRLYFVSETGEIMVVEVGPEYKEIARNPLNETTLASPAVSGQSIYLRTESHLYRIGQAGAATLTSANHEDGRKLQ